MTTAAKARVVTTDAEIDEAIARGKSASQNVAIRATYRPEHDQIWAELNDGVVTGFPRRLLQGLENASPEDLNEIELEGGGTGLFWPRLNVAHYLPGLIDGVFGTRKWMADLGRRGGSVKSDRKTAAVRKNGKKGGRPKKVAAD
jgi:hypothetical protein